MGMFNYVECEMPLPNFDGKLKNAQTKALGSLDMDSYIIREDGTLVVLRYDMRPTQVWERIVLPGFKFETRTDPPEDDECDNWYQQWERHNERYEVMDFTGEFNFYGGKDDEGWLEFVATVKNGKVTAIRRDTEREFRMNRMMKKDG